MKKFLPLTFLFLFLFLNACGHTTDLLDDGTSDNPDTPIDTDTSVPTDWKQVRNTAASSNNVVSTSLTPVPAQTYTESSPATQLDAYIQQIVKFTTPVNSGAGFGQSTMSTLLLGPPYGGGQFSGSTDVVSLGNNGEIILGFPRFFPIDGSGSDFVVFENPFQPGGVSASLFREPATVGVSQDGTTFYDFPCNCTVIPYTGCAGTHAVLANPDDNTINARDAATAGGDAYDLATLGLGLKYVQFIRIKDCNSNLGGNPAIVAGQAGFDLDAISVVHGSKP